MGELLVGAITSALCSEQPRDTRDNLQTHQPLSLCRPGRFPELEQGQKKEDGKQGPAARAIPVNPQRIH